MAAIARWKMNTFPLEKPAAVTRNLLLCCARCLSLVPTRTKQIIFFRCVQKSVLKKYRRRMKTKTSYFPTTTLVSVKPKIIIPGPGLLLYISTTGQQVQMQPTHSSLRSSGFFLYFLKIKISKIYVCFEVFQKYPRSPPIGRQALSVIFLFKFAMRSLGKKIVTEANRNKKNSQ